MNNIWRSILLVWCAASVLLAQTFKEEQDRFPRVRQARENKEHSLDSLFTNKGLDYPPHRILIVAYKHEQMLELWARPETTTTLTLIKQYPFTAYCGALGPKRRQGDMQIPEGVYTLTHFNPYSNFHLSMLVSYPNRSDRIQSPYSNLGGEIRIHGSYVTIGCIPIGDNAIEELYITCVDAKSGGQEHIPVYIFPTRMNDTGMRMLHDVASDDSILWKFWQNLKTGYALWSTTHTALDYTINTQGFYVFAGNMYKYPWLGSVAPGSMLVDRILPPAGFLPCASPACSFADWLQHIPLKPGNPDIMVFNGSAKQYQGGHAAIIDMPVGNQDLQQCADAIIRLRAEYLYSIEAYDAISFTITNGDDIAFRRWINGYRPAVSGNTVTWSTDAMIDSSYATLQEYLRFIFTYAGSYSLSRQMKTMAALHDMEIGDVFIQGGFPGHAVIVTNMAEHAVTNERAFLLAQSYMPAQDIHILNNLNDPGMNPWYPLDFGDTLYTPEWTFTKDDLKRF